MKLEELTKKFKKKKDKTMLQIQFISFFSYFSTFISSGENVYQAISYCVDALNGEIQEYVAELQQRIDKDKSMTPFMEFAQHFDNETITQIVTMMYQYNQSGSGIEELNNMLPLLDRLKNITVDEYVKKENSSLNLFLATPLIGVTIVSLAFSLGVLSAIVVSI